MSNTSHSEDLEQVKTLSDQEFLSFILDDEEFGVDILAVKEIRVWSPVTEIPGTPTYLKGVINLRGVIIPIVDLRLRFNKPLKDYSATTVVIVLRTEVNQNETMVGIVVDAVSEVYKVNKQNIRKAPNFGSSIDTRFITGMATMAKKLLF